MSRPWGTWWNEAVTDTSTPARPSQVTMAGWMIIVGSVVVVLTAFEVVSGVRSLDTRESVEEFLAEPPGSGLGIGVESALQTLRVLAMVAAGCATASAILGWHVLKRNRSARLALSVIAVPLFVSGLVAGGFMSSIVVVAAMMLWLQPARDWFNGVTPQRANLRSMVADPFSRRTSGQDEADAAGAGSDRPASPPVSAPVQPPASPPADGSAGEPRPWSGFGDQPSPGLAPLGSPFGGPPAGEAPTARPGAVTVACVITWVFSGLALALSLLSFVAVAVAPSAVLDELLRQDPQFDQQGLSDPVVVSTLLVFTVLLALWSVAGIVLAALVHRRVGWARIALIISAAMVAVFALLGSISSFVLVVPLVAGTLTVSLLLRRETRAWFASGQD